jgi:hypothetical protein
LLTIDKLSGIIYLYFIEQGLVEGVVLEENTVHEVALGCLDVEWFLVTTNLSYDLAYVGGGVGHPRVGMSISDTR